jgi:hypothetical protein
MKQLRRVGLGMMCWLLASCGNQAPIPETDFTDILTEMQVASAYFTAQGIGVPLWDSLPYNRHIVERHGYRWEQFDSTVSWYSAKPKQYQEVYQKVIDRLTAMEKAAEEEPDPPEELWHGRKAWQLPIDGARDSIPMNLPLRGEGKYIISAKINVHPTDDAIAPRIALCWVRADSTGKTSTDTFRYLPLRQDGLPVTYSFEQIIRPDDHITTLKGVWLGYHRNIMDSTWSRRATVEDFSVYHIPMKFK